MKKLSKIFFGLILVLALVFRFWHLNSLPAGLNWDEISHGYNAYSILKTGKDQWGIKLPVFNFRAYGDYPTTLNLYLTIPFIQVFGLNALAIRLPAAILGLLFVVLVYFFVKYISQNTTTALFAMLLAAVSPWSLFPSRGVFQSNLSQLLFLLGLLLFYHALKKPKLFLLSLLSFGLSMYAYHNTRIIAPMTIVLLFVAYFKELKKLFYPHKLLLIFSLVLFLFLAIPNLLNLFSPESTARNRWVGIINPNTINLINESRRLYTGPAILNRLINNKIVSTPSGCNNSTPRSG